MIDYAGRQGLKVEVAHAVTAYYHRVSALAEFVNNFLQCIGTAVEVVAVQLDCKASAALIIYGKVPAAAYAQVGALGYDMHQALIGPGKIREYLSGAVGGVVVNHNHVVRAVQLLAQCRLDGICHCTLAVADGNDDRCQYGETAVGCVDLCSGSGLEVTVNQFEVLGACGLHLYLDVAVARVYVVELLLARCTEISLGYGVERLGNTYNRESALYGQTHLIESGGLEFLTLE